MTALPQDPGTVLENHLVACIQENLALYLFNNAIFLAERLVAEFPSEQNVYLLSSCYHRSQQTYRAYALLRGLQGPQSRYLFALCCLDMGKLSEAESALMPDADITRVPNGAAGFFLLGRIFQLSNRHSIAIIYYNSALQLDPMMWCAYEELCALGADHEVQQYVNAQQAAPGGEQQQQDMGGGPSPMNPSPAPGPRPTRSGRDADSMASMQEGRQPPQWQSMQQGEESMDSIHAQAYPCGGEAGTGFTFNTHTPPGAAAAAAAGVTPAGATPMMGSYQNDAGRWMSSAVPSTLGTHTKTTGGFITPAAGGQASGPPPLPRVAAAWPLPGLPSGASPSALPSWQSGGHQRKFLDEGKMRKISSKLFVEPASILKHIAGGSVGGPGRPGVPHPDDGAALLQTAAVAGVPRGERSLEGQASAVTLLQALGEGYRLLCSYKCKEALDAFGRLPAHHLQTGWVLMQMGRAFFEMVDYPRAAEAFQLARRVDPYRLQGLEVYSTVLWHMKGEVELAELAREAVALDRLSPAAWCIMGNCFSLQKEHEAALRFFQRALQLDHNLPYAYTLCGHEYFANEDFEKGITCYRNAIRIDPRHYNAWFGMGHIYYRQEKFGMAEYHFRRALSINDRSSVLRCYLGMALQKLKRNAEALEMLASAIAADPRNPLARFERAGVLAADGQLEEALSELQALHDVAPREASVLFHMGKVLKRMGRTQDALAAFSEALDLQPPSADTNLIKAAIDRVTMADAEEEEEL